MRTLRNMKVRRSSKFADQKIKSPYFAQCPFQSTAFTPRDSVLKSDASSPKNRDSAAASSARVPRWCEGSSSSKDGKQHRSKQPCTADTELPRHEKSTEHKPF